jgi:hypothetical protein
MTSNQLGRLLKLINFERIDEKIEQHFIYPRNHKVSRTNLLTRS